MYKTISNIDEIRVCQKQLEKALKSHLSKKGTFTIGFHGGNFKESVRYNDLIWYFSFEIDQNENSPRFWNGFGLSSELNNQKSNNIVVEINIPTTGINRQVAGFFAKDEDENIFLLHRGSIGGGRKGIGKKAFLDWSSYQMVDVSTDNMKEHALLIGQVNNSLFIRQLHDFILKVSQFKAFVVSGNISEASDLSDQELMKKINEDLEKLKKPMATSTTIIQFNRSPLVKELVIRRAKGNCQLCTEEAPFKDKIGKPFLETHHLKWLSQGGEDTPSNVVALCPNCHRKMHVLNDPIDIKTLKNRI